MLACMRTHAAALTLLAVAAGATCELAHAVDPLDTLLLQQPDISEQSVAFVYDNDIWVADRNGGAARRLTSAPGPESAPHFSRDGSTIAFSGNYDGNIDVYIIPAAGGAPRRLTWHGGPDIVQGFLPDGRVLFSSYRYLHTDRMLQLFAVPVAGGMPERLPVPDGDDAQVSPDGLQIAYSTMPPAYKNAVPQAKNYRGGDASRIWIMNLRDYQVRQVPQPQTGSNDLNPVWIDDRLYFTSDRAGEFNLFSLDLDTSVVVQLTDYRDFPIFNLNDGGGLLIYEQAGALHVFDPSTRGDRRLKVAVGAELRETRPRYVSDPSYVRSVALSPDATRAVIEYRGEIVTVPLEGGNYRNLTRSAGANDRSPAWSADGRRMAWFSDLSDEYALYVVDPDNGARPRRIDLQGAGFYEDLKWSPDGRFVSFRDNSLSLHIVDVQSGAARFVGHESAYSPSGVPRHNWSPDSKWLAYSIAEHGMVQTVYLYSIEQQRSYRVTGELVDAGEPVFDPAGDYLYVLASIDAGPVRDWFTQSRAGQSVTRTLYAIALSANSPSGAQKTKVSIDLEGLAERAIAFPQTKGALRNLQVAGSREVFYVATSAGDAASLMHYSPDLRSPGENRPQTLMDAVSDYTIVNGSVLYQKGSAWKVARLGSKIEDSAAKTVPTETVAVLIEPSVEWRQIAREGWRLQRDYFYADNFHGADWNAIWNNYAPFLDHAATRNDVQRIQSWMSSELAVSHGYVFPGEALEDPSQVSVGLLGADFAVASGRFRFDKVYTGHWTPDLVAPLGAPQAHVTRGEYLLAVEGQQLHAPRDNLYSFFQNTVGRTLRLTVGPHEDGRGSREIEVVPVADETVLRRIDWIEGNIRKVDAATRGRVAYVHAPDTTARGLALFKRYFYPQSHKEAIIVDARFNGGGSSGDYYIDLLRRGYVGEFATRYGDEQHVPRGAIFGPKVLITNKMARSGGDLLAYSFRKLKLGPIVGARTTGALVGNLGIPELMDGGVVTAPNFAFWTQEEGWSVENVGVRPDYEVEQWPAAVNSGLDPQLEKAIETVMEMLPKTPPPKRMHPAYPVRAGQQGGAAAARDAEP